MSQRPHEYAYCVIFELLSHSPFDVVSFCPTVVVPLIAGCFMGAGWPYSYWAALDEPKAPPLVTSSVAAAAVTAPSSTLRTQRALDVCVMRSSPSESSSHRRSSA